MGLLSDIGEGPVALDASIFIYFLEGNPRYLPLVRPLFQAIADERLTATTSSLTLLETLVVPLRAGNLHVAREYESLLTNSLGLELVEIDSDLLRAAAQLRAATRIKTPDALQVAAAMRAGCPVFVTNDRRLPSVPGLRILELESYLESA